MNDYQSIYRNCIRVITNCAYIVDYMYNAYNIDLGASGKILSIGLRYPLGIKIIIIIVVIIIIIFIIIIIIIIIFIIVIRYDIRRNEMDIKKFNKIGILVHCASLRRTSTWIFRIHTFLGRVLPPYPN